MSETHPIMPSVEIVLDGRKFNLVFDFNAQAIFEEITGVTVLSLFDRKGKYRGSSRHTRAFLFSQLLHGDEQVQFDEFGRINVPPEFNMLQVGRMITRDNLKEVTTKTNKALINFFKANTEEKAPAENPPSR